MVINGIHYFQNTLFNKNSNLSGALEDQFSTALRANNIEVATKIVDLELKQKFGGPGNFNKLHYEVQLGVQLVVCHKSDGSKNGILEFII